MSATLDRVPNGRRWIDGTRLSAHSADVVVSR